MPRFLRDTGLIFSAALLFTTIVLAEEEITITTYYPSPYGVYNQLQTNRLAVGDANNNGSLDAADQPNRDGDIRLKAQTGDPNFWPAGATGQFSYSSADDSLYHYNGSSWVAQGGGGGGSVTLIGQGGSTPACPAGWTSALSGYWNCAAHGLAPGYTVLGAGDCFCGQASSYNITPQAEFFAFYSSRLDGGSYIGCRICVK